MTTAQRWKLALIIFAVMMACSIRCVPALVGGGLTTGESLNNPGLLRPDHWDHWTGCTGIDEQGYAIFKEQIDGLRGIVINLKAYRDKRHLKTVRQIVYKWTWREDHTRVNYRNYVNFVAKRLGVKPDKEINLWDSRTLLLLTRSIIFFENGRDIYPASLYRKIFPREDIPR